MSTLRTLFQVAVIPVLAGLIGCAAMFYLAPWLSSYAPIPASNLCVIDQDKVIAQSVAGDNAGRQLQQLHDRLQHEIDQERGQINADTAVEKSGALATLDQKAAQLTRQLTDLRASIVARLNRQEQVLLAANAASRGCSLVVLKATVALNRSATDLTDETLAAMNKSLAPFPILVAEKPALPK